MTDIPATAWLHGVQIGKFEIEPSTDDADGGTWGWWGVLYLSPGTEQLHEIVRLGDGARGNLGFLAGVTDEGDRRGRAAMWALRELEIGVEVRTANETTLDARVGLWPIENAPDALRALINLNSAGEGGAAIGARIPVPPRPTARESSRPDV